MSSRPSTNPRVLRIGIIGCGEVTQVIHIPNLTALSSHFRTAYLCDLSPLALTHCSSKIPGPGPATTHNAAELCASPDVDVVLVASADAFHVPHALLALQHNKYCLLEKPAALCGRDVDVLVAAERASKGKIFVGTMRRYAAVLADAVEEIGGMDQIKYARVRDIIGKNQTFVAQSGMFPKRFTDISDSDAEDLKRREEDMHVQALKEEFGVPVTKASRDMLRLLGGLGTHDLSLMREVLGPPLSVAGAILTPTIWTALFQYPGFHVTYESGIINVPEFDAHIEVYSLDKVVRVQYDTPYVRGLPITMTVKEKVGDGGFQERKVRKTYQDPYTEEMLAFWECVVEETVPKTSVQDVRGDVEIFGMVLRAGVGSLGE